MAFFDDGDHGGVVEQIEGSMSHLAGAAERLAFIINGVSSERAYLALCRTAGRPTEADRALWRGLRAVVPAEKLLDLVVFNRRETWSMRGEDMSAQRAADG
jgi:cob(I)alamin adenosyltransferase